MPFGARSPSDGTAITRRVVTRRTVVANLSLSVRLPTESEWEYAARAGTTTEFHFGDVIDDTKANYDTRFNSWNGSPLGKSREQTTDVKAFAPNAWGLYDTHGNVAEWCHDWYDVYPAAAQTDPQGPASGDPRILRGGAWNATAAECRSASRGFAAPE